MFETILVLFTAMEPNVPPMLQEVPVSTFEICEALVSDTKTWDNINVTARCEKRILVKEKK